MEYSTKQRELLEYLNKAKSNYYRLPEWKQHIMVAALPEKPDAFLREKREV